MARRELDVTDPAIERFIDVNGLRMHVLEQGRGPLVVLLHGFPDLPYMWKHVMSALAAAGFRAVAPAQRGFGRTGEAGDVSQYTILHLVGDIVALLDALGAREAVVVGHDWGATVAWNCALLRPDRFRAVAALSTPFTPRSEVRTTDRIRHFVGDGYSYVLHFQEPGVAEADLASLDLRQAFRRIFYSASGDAPVEHRWRPSGPRGTRFLDGTREPANPPSWWDEDHIERYANEFSRTGFTGALNWYRAMDLSWALTASFSGLSVTVPALFAYGEEDAVARHMHRAILGLRRLVPDLRQSLAMPGAGHWITLERRDEVNALLLRFLRMNVRNGDLAEKERSRASVSETGSPS
jgi:pimeloyl-ACP methyl ester carboxylesterase